MFWSTEEEEIKRIVKHITNDAGELDTKRLAAFIYETSFKKPTVPYVS